MAEPRQQPVEPDAPSQQPVAATAGKAGLHGRGSIGKKVLALACLVAVARVEYYLVNLPVGEIQNSKKFGPAEVQAGSEFVTFDHPDSGGGRFSFSFAQPESQSQKVLLDARFDSAQLADETLAQLKSLGVAPPAALGAVSYLTSTAGSGACSTTLQVNAGNPAPASVEFTQDNNELPDNYRQLGVRFAGADAALILTSEGALEHILSPCKVELSVADWKQVIPGFISIKLRVPAGAQVRFQWQNINQRLTSSLLKFGPASKETFTAEAVRIDLLPGQTDKPRALEAKSESKSSPLTVKLEIDANELQVNASGTGRVVENGKTISTTNALEAINKNPILSTMFGGANVALIGWVTRMFFPARRKRKPQD
jgi:hypothetical protein